MKKFSKREIAGLLACMSFFGNKTSAMNQSEVKNLGTIGRAGGAASGNKNSKNKIPAPPKGLPKKFYPLWIALSALGLSAVVILGILGIKKLCSKDSGDQGETPNGTFYYGLGKFKNIEELKDAWNSKDCFCGPQPDKNSTIVCELVKLIKDNKEFGEFLKGDHKQESELASIKGDFGIGEDYHPFSSYAEIRFDDKDNFECYDNKGKKLNLLTWERFFIDYIAKYTKNKLGILPCMVQYDGELSFYFIFSFDASSEDFKENRCINSEDTLIRTILNTHVSSFDSEIFFELELCGKK